MIVELIQHRGILLAANSLGQLLGWTIRPRNSQHLFQTNLNTSIVPSSLKIVIDPTELLGLASLENHLITYSHKNLYVIESKKLKQYEKQGSNIARVIKAGKILGDDDLIKCVAGVSNQKILIGTSKGSIVLVNIVEETAEKTVAFSSLVKKSKQILAFGTTFQKPQQITSIVLFQDKCKALVSLNSGKLFVIDVETFRVVNEITESISQPLDRINRIYLKQNENKVYTLHNSYILEWNFMLNRCISSIEYCSPHGIIAESNKLAIVGSNSTLTLLTQEQRNVELTMKGAGAIYQLGNLMLVGGTNNLVDVFENGARRITLISK